MEVSDVAEAEESKTVKIKSHVLRCQRHCPHCVLATGPDDQSASLQRDPVAFASFSVQEEMRVVADNAPAHNALSIWQFLAEKNIIVLEEPPYSPDLALCDFSFPQTQGDHQGDLF